MLIVYSVRQGPVLTILVEAQFYDRIFIQQDQDTNLFVSSSIMIIIINKPFYGLIMEMSKALFMVLSFLFLFLWFYLFMVLSLYGFIFLLFFNFHKKLKNNLSLDSFIFLYTVFWKDVNTIMRDYI